MIALALAVAGGGCAAMERLGLKPPSAPVDQGPSRVEQARTALGAGNLDAANTILTTAPPPTKGDNVDATSNAETAELLLLRAELRIRQGRFPEAESDALTAMALVPATAAPEPAAAPAQTEVTTAAPTDPSAEAVPPPVPPRPALTQRSIHIRLAQLLEDASRDDDAVQHAAAAHQLCLDDEPLRATGDCNLEREVLVRIFMARGQYAQAEPLVLEEISDVQARFGAYDIRLSFAFCHVAEFYARQGNYALSGPLFARSFDLWNTMHEDAQAEHQRALAQGYPSPFDANFLRPRAGHAPFAAPCGLEDQPALLFKLGKSAVAHDATKLEQRLWSADSEAGTAAVTALNALVNRSADPLDVASARHAVAFVAQKKGDQARAEKELRLVVDAYAAAWPTLPRSERRYLAEDYLVAMESLTELYRSSRRFGETTTMGEQAAEVAVGTVNAYDALRLDTLLSQAKTFREMRDSRASEDAAVRYLDAIIAARGDRSSDYAFALRTLSYAYLLRGETDASQRMEMQAQAIWARQSVVAPAF